MRSAASAAKPSASVISMPLSVQSILHSGLDGTSKIVDTLEITLVETSGGKGRYVGLMRDQNGRKIAEGETWFPLREDQSFRLIGCMLAQMAFVHEDDCIHT